MGESVRSHLALHGSPSGAKFWYANLATAALKDVWLNRDDSTVVDLRRTEPVQARLHGPNRRRAYLHGSNLRRADPSYAG